MSGDDFAQLAQDGLPTLKVAGDERSLVDLLVETGFGCYAARRSDGRSGAQIHTRGCGASEWREAERGVRQLGVQTAIHYQYHLLRRGKNNFIYWFGSNFKIFADSGCAVSRVAYNARPH